KVSVMSGWPAGRMSTVANPYAAPLRTKVRCRPDRPLLRCLHSLLKKVARVRKTTDPTPTASGTRLLALAALATAAITAGCAATGTRDMVMAGDATGETLMFEHQRSSTHRDGDDLLTAGLGIDGLRQMVPPAFADAEAPTAAELRRRALWSNWRGIADLGPAGGYGELYGSVAAVPGREFSSYATVQG